jgi:hypothetical protein
MQSARQTLRKLVLTELKMIGEDFERPWIGVFFAVTQMLH